MFKQILSYKILAHKHNKGFTLIELVAVMAIIGVLAVALVPSIEAAMNRSENTKIITNLAKIDGAVKIYQLEHDGEVPESLTVLNTNRYIEKATYKGIEYKKGEEDDTYSLTGTNSHGDVITPDGNISVQ